MMKKIVMMLATIAAAVAVQNAAAQQGDDPANLARYAADNARIKASGPKPDVVFMGNSITEGWPRLQPDMFSDGYFVGRGISGQVTGQMLARFQADVVDLAPTLVVILGGINDIAQNQGPIALEDIAANIYKMVEMARQNGIVPILCSVLPASSIPWRAEVRDVADKVRALNAMLKEWAAANRCEWVDFSAMADERGGLPANYAEDGIHPTAAGYARMTSIITPNIDALLR